MSKNNYLKYMNKTKKNFKKYKKKNKMKEREIH